MEECIEHGIRLPCLSAPLSHREMAFGFAVVLGIHIHAGYLEPAPSDMKSYRAYLRLECMKGPTTPRQYIADLGGYECGSYFILVLPLVYNSFSV